jgi:N-acylneuraminate cytidylyltransferase
LAVPRVDRVIVSTDSAEIAAVARQFGAETPFIRPAELASDESPEWLSWRHALSYLRDTEVSMPAVMLSVPATAPLRKPSDIENCLDEYEKGGADAVITVTAAHRSPYFNMVRMDADGSVGPVIPPVAPIARRQDVPVVYDMATVAYVIRPEFVFSGDGIFQGRVRAVEVPKERAIDIDTMFDFQVAEFLLSLGEA